MEIARLLTNARVGEVADSGGSIQNVYATSGITDDATLQMIIDELKESTDALTSAVEKDKAVSKLEQVDEQRDKALQDIYHYLQGLLRVPGDVAASAGRLLTIFEKYGIGIVSQSYAEQSTSINSLLGDWSSDESETDMASIFYLTGMVTTLSEAQKTFESTYESYLTELAKSKSEQSASAIKPETLNIINNRLVKYLRAQAEFNAETYGDFAQKVNIVITRINGNVRERRAKHSETTE